MSTGLAEAERSVERLYCGLEAFRYRSTSWKAIETSGVVWIAMNGVLMDSYQTMK
jgi:hypothetical protein